MVGTAVLASGALYIGYRAYHYGAAEQSPGWWQPVVSRLHALRQQLTKADQSPKQVSSLAVTLNQSTLVEANQTNTQAVVYKQRLLLSATTLGLVTAGAAYYPPARLAALPVLLYLGVKPAWQLQAALRRNGHIAADLVEITVIVVTAAQGYYLIGILGCSLYALAQLFSDRPNEQRTDVDHWQPPLWAWRQSEAGEQATRLTALQAGDTICVHAGEMVPLAGVITSGTAWVQRADQAQLRPARAQGVGEKVTVGDRVEATTIVMVGTLSITVIATIDPS